MLAKTQNNNIPEEIEQIYKLRESIEEYKERELIYKEKI